MSLCGRLKCFQKNPGDNEGPALLLSPLARKKKKKTPLRLATVSELDQETVITRVPDEGLSSLSDRRFPALVRDHQGEKRQEDDGNQKETKLMRRIQSKQREQRL